jgi:hypothetical protein
MAIIRTAPKKRPAAPPFQLGARLAPGRYAAAVAAPRFAPSVAVRAMPTVMLRRIGGNYYSG